MSNKAVNGMPRVVFAVVASLLVVTACGTVRQSATAAHCTDPGAAADVTISDVQTPPDGFSSAVAVVVNHTAETCDYGVSLAFAPSPTGIQGGAWNVEPRGHTRVQLLGLIVRPGGYRLEVVRVASPVQLHTLRLFADRPIWSEQ